MDAREFERFCQHMIRVSCTFPNIRAKRYEIAINEDDVYTNYKAWANHRLLGMPDIRYKVMNKNNFLRRFRRKYHLYIRDNSLRQDLLCFNTEDECDAFDNSFTLLETLANRVFTVQNDIPGLLITLGLERHLERFRVR